MKDKFIRPIVALAALAALGGGVGVAALASAQTSTTTQTAVTETTAAEATETHHMGHMSLGQDGNITAINGTTITMKEESDEGSAVYTVDASGATITKGGAASSVSGLSVGDKIFVQGTVSGTNVTATAVSDGPHGMWHGQKQ